MPYYRDLFRRLRLSSDAVVDAATLRRLPILSKGAIGGDGVRFEPAALPRGEKPGNPTESSGTTGRKVRVVHTEKSRFMFGLLKQREYRWFRYDPAGLLANIRSPDVLPRTDDGALVGPGSTAPFPVWLNVGDFFRTGPFIGFSRFNRPDRMAEWLDRHRPDYLVTNTAIVEHVALARRERPGAHRLGGLEAISEPLTGGMRRNIEESFGIPLDTNYGLNEVGVIASSCRQGGRLHVHTELAHVEIVDDHGNPVPPGAIGRVLVTPLMNPAMPLLRYDTDDLAEAADGPCPCGRTLPAIGRIVGRISRRDCLPEGTEEAVATLRRTVEDLPAGLSTNLRQYQIHQNRDGSYELRLASVAPLPGGLMPHLERSWQSTDRLDIVETDYIAQGERPKYLHFTSDFIAVDAAARAHLAKATGKLT